MYEKVVVACSVWNIKSGLFVERARPQVLEGPLEKMEVRFKDQAVSATDVKIL